MTHSTARPPKGRIASYCSMSAGSVVGAFGRLSVITKNCGQRCDTAINLLKIALDAGSATAQPSA